MVRDASHPFIALFVWFARGGAGRRRGDFWGEGRQGVTAVRCGGDVD